MKVILMKRGKGKTTKLIKLSAKTGDVIVTYSMDYSKLIMQKANRMEVAIPPPLSYSQLLNGLWKGKRISGFLFDDAEMLFQTICSGIPVHAISLTKD